MIIDCLREAAGRGAGERLLPRLARETSAELVEAVLVTNPARWLTGAR